MAGVITLAVLLAAMGLPTDYIGMFMAIDILCDMPKTLGVFVALDYLHYNYDKWEQMPVQIQNNPTIKEMVAEWQRAATEIMPQIELNEEIITIE